MAKICIGLCVFNNEFGLPYVLKNISKLKPLFEEIVLVAFYDISADNSLEVLKQQCIELELYTEIIINQQRPPLSRTGILAMARNAILNRIRNNFNDFTYFAMMDCNHYACVGEIRPNVIQLALDRKDEWDSISFYRDDGYYDFWALSMEPYIYSFVHFENQHQMIDSMRDDISKRITEEFLQEPDKLIQVYSSFNGFSIYKMEKFIDCSYSSEINIKLFPLDLLKNQVDMFNNKMTLNFTCDCEHRHFHLQAIKKNDARIMICFHSLFGPIPEKSYEYANITRY